MIVPRCERDPFIGPPEPLDRCEWTCERCGGHWDAGETYFSAEHCNAEGIDVVLCRPCAVTAENDGPNTHPYRRGGEP